MKYLPSVFDIFTLIYFTWTSAFFSRSFLQKFLRNGISSQEIIRLHCFQSHKPTLIRRFGHGMVDMIYDIESTRHLSSSNPLIPLHLFLEFSKSFYGEGHVLYIRRQMNIILKNTTNFLFLIIWKKYMLSKIHFTNVNKYKMELKLNCVNIFSSNKVLQATKYNVFYISWLRISKSTRNSFSLCILNRLFAMQKERPMAQCKVNARLNQL